MYRRPTLLCTLPLQLGSPYRDSIRANMVALVNEPISIYGLTGQAVLRASAWGALTAPSCTARINIPRLRADRLEMLSSACAPAASLTPHRVSPSPGE
eukprot:3124419-Pyramimonas_sp.AAC.1